VTIEFIYDFLSVIPTAEFLPITLELSCLSPPLNWVNGSVTWWMVERGGLGGFDRSALHTVESSEIWDSLVWSILKALSGWRLPLSAWLVDLCSARRSERELPCPVFPSLL